MSLLSICQNVARIAPAAIPASIINSGDSNALLLLAAAQEAGESLARRPQGGWTAMIREYDFSTFALVTTGNTTNGSPIVTNIPSTVTLAAKTFYATGLGILNNSTILTVDSSTQVTLNQNANATGVGVAITFGQSDYALPSDFERLVDGTLWDRSRFWEMRGPQSPQEWQLYKSSVIGRASIQRRWRIRNIAGVQKFSVDPVPFDTGAALVFEYVSNAWCQSNGTPPVPQTSWLADTDTGILDEYLIQLGVKWRFLRRLGMSYSEELDEYEREADKAMAHDGGASVLSLTASSPSATPLLSSMQIPDTGFGPQ